jgi:hypothetical protein
LERRILNPPFDDSPYGTPEIPAAPARGAVHDLLDPLAGIRNHAGWAAVGSGWVARDGKKPKSVPGGDTRAGYVAATAGTYEEATATARTLPVDNAGLGVVMGDRGDGYELAFWDQDNVRDPIRGLISPLTKAIDETNSYREISLSHTGVHDLLWLSPDDAQLVRTEIARRKRSGESSGESVDSITWKTQPIKGQRTRGAELFLANRYVALTGWRSSGSSEGPVTVSADVILRTFRALDEAFGRPDCFDAVAPGEPRPPQVPTAQIADTEPLQGLDLTTLEPELRQHADDAMRRYPILGRRVRGDFSGPVDQSGSGRKMALIGAAKRAGLEKDEAYELARLHPATAESAEKEGQRGLERAWGNAGEAEEVDEAEVFKHVVPLQDAVVDQTNRTQRRVARKMIRRSRQELANIPPTAWFYSGLIPAEGIVFIAGAPKSGKTFIVLLLIMCAAAGVDFAGVPSASGPVDVSIWAGEGVGGVNARMTAVETHHGLDVGDRFTVVTGPFVVEELIELYADKLLKILVIDTLARATAAAGLDENSAKDMGLFVAALDRIRDALGCLIIVIAHTGKDEARGVRGSSALLGAADAVFVVSQKAPGLSSFVNIAMKEAELAEALMFEVKKVGDSAAAVVSEHLTPALQGGQPKVPQGEVEIVLMEVLETLTPDPTKIPMPGSPHLHAVLAGLASHAVRIENARELFVTRRQASRAMAVQAFGRGMERLAKKGLVYVTGDWVQLVNKGHGA